MIHRLALAVMLTTCSLPLSAQRVVHESMEQWLAARVLPLTREQTWCRDPDAEGCDFRSPASVRALPDGGILASDAMGPLRRFGADGRYRATLGRKGKGPGEYGFVVDASLASDGLVTWFDNTQMRIATISLDGIAGPVRRLMPPYTMALMFLMDTSLVVLDVPAAARVGDEVEATYRTVPVSGAPRVLARVRTPSTFTPGSDMRPMSGPFDPRVLGDVSARGDVIHSNGVRYEVDAYPAGQTPWRLMADAPARPVTATERDSARGAILRRFRVSATSALPPSVQGAFERSPATHPPLVQLKLLRDGTVWIKPTPPAGATSERWDVFTRDGTRAGMVRLPRRARVWDGTRDWVLVTELGPDDLPIIVRYRVSRQ